MDKGHLGVLEFSLLEFLPRRIYWLTGTPPVGERGHHAHKALIQLLVVLTGSVTVDIYEGIRRFTYNLDAESPSLLIHPGIWRVLRNFSPETCILVICDKDFSESDYIRNFEEYLTWFRRHHE